MHTYNKERDEMSSIMVYSTSTSAINITDASYTSLLNASVTTTSAAPSFDVIAFQPTALLYIFLPVVVILVVGGTVLAFKYVKRRSGAKRLKKQLVPLKQYDVSTDFEQDDHLLEVKLVEPCCNDPLLAFKPVERPNSLEVQNIP